MNLNPGMISLSGVFMTGPLEIKAVKIEKPDDVNFILGQSHFIEDR